MANKTLEQQAQEKIAAADAARSAALEAEAERKRKASERQKLFGERLDVLQAAAARKCTPGTHVAVKRNEQGLALTFGTDTLIVSLHDLGDAEVDFWGTLTVQRAGWSFFFRPDGVFVWVRFKPNAIINTRRTWEELIPRNDHEFRDYMRGANVAHTVTVEWTSRSLEDVLEEAIAKLIQLSSV